MKKNVLILLSVLIIAMFVVGCVEEVSDEELNAELEELSDEEFIDVVSEEEPGALVGNARAGPISKTRSKVKKSSWTWTCTDDGNEVTYASSSGYENIIDKNKCLGANDLYEIYCRGNEIMSKEIAVCENGCDDGACKTMCFDPDKVNPVAKKTTVKSIVEGVVIDSKTDTCAPDDEILEFSCLPNGKIQVATLSCPEGVVCLDGACKYNLPDLRIDEVLSIASGIEKYIHLEIENRGDKDSGEYKVMEENLVFELYKQDEKLLSIDWECSGLSSNMNSLGLEAGNSDYLKCGVGWDIVFDSLEDFPQTTSVKISADFLVDSDEEVVESDENNNLISLSHSYTMGQINSW
jgi:hypothetical protein